MGGRFRKKFLKPGHLNLIGKDELEEMESNQIMEILICHAEECVFYLASLWFSYYLFFFVLFLWSDTIKRGETLSYEIAAVSGNNPGVGRLHIILKDDVQFF